MVEQVFPPFNLTNGLCGLETIRRDLVIFSSILVFRLYQTMLIGSDSIDRSRV